MRKTISNILFVIAGALSRLAWKVLTPNQVLELEMELEDAAFQGTISEPVEFKMYEVGEVPPEGEFH